MARATAVEPVPVPEWLILGSFPLRERTQGRWTESGYPCESAFAPQLGDCFDGARWVRYDTPRGRIEFFDAALSFDRRLWCFAYAATYVRSPAKQRVELHVGSDNGVTVWLNAEELLRYECGQQTLVDTNAVTVTLQEGWNLLLIKAAQGGGPWGLKAHFAPAGKRRTAPRLGFSLKRPSARQFPGLSRRRRGLMGRWAFHLARPEATPSRQLALAFALGLFNDSMQTASRVRLALHDANGKVLARANVPAIPAFSSAAARIQVDMEELVVALLDAGDKRLSSSVKSSLGEIEIELPADALARLFCNTMTDLPLSLDRKGTTRFVVPEMLAGASARAEVCVLDESALTREHGWPELPSEEFGAEATLAKALDITLTPPMGMPALGGRIVFGEPSARPLADRVRRLVNELGMDLRGGAEAAADGSHALFRGDVAGAWDAIARIADGVAKAQSDRRSESVTLVGHAHTDMNWLWTQEETLKCGHDTFRQVLAFMNEFPDFCFSQSQPVLYEMIERFDPGMFKDIQRRVEDSRWELLGGFLTEGDTNLASGEGLARAVLLGQHYFRDRFGKIARVGWLPDNFGHVAQLPQIHRQAGMAYFYGHRCQPGVGPYVWEGVDGSRVMCYATPTYNGAVDASIRDVPALYNPKHRKAVWIYGVGDHGGGPTRRDIRLSHIYDDAPGSPKIHCGTAEGFFRTIEPHADEYDVHRGELQYVFEGCYTSVARIKEGNRVGENLMYTAEMLAAIMALRGAPYPRGKCREVWHALAFNQFHDILCGSATHDSNRESIARYDHAIANARTLLFEGMRRLTQRIDTRSCGQPIVVFNPLPREQSDIVEAEVFSHEVPVSADIRRWWDHEYRPVQAKDVGDGPCPSVHLVDHEGTEVPAQVVDGKYFPNGCRLKVQFPAQGLPACGYKVYHVFPGAPGAKPAKDFVVRETSIETPHFKLEVDKRTGHVTRLYDKRRKVEVLRKGEPVNVLKVYMEKPHGMSAWELGPISAVHTLGKAESVRVVERGPVRAAIEVKRSWNRSSFTQRIFVYRDTPRVDFELDVRWFELGGPDHDAPTLRVAFPLNVRHGRFVCDTPFAAVERPTNGREVPAQKWIDFSGPRGGAALLNDSKYGHRCTEHVLETTLLRASYDPDKYPDLGPHVIRYALLPHGGSWSTAGVADAGIAFNARCVGIEASPHGGDLGPVHGFVQVEPANVLLSGIKQPEEGHGLIVRVFEACGKPTEATVRLAWKPRYAERADLLEDRDENEDAPRIEGDCVHVALRGHQIATLRIE